VDSAARALTPADDGGGDGDDGCFASSSVSGSRWEGSNDLSVQTEMTHCHYTIEPLLHLYVVSSFYIGAVINAE